MRPWEGTSNESWARGLDMIWGSISRRNSSTCNAPPPARLALNIEPIGSRMVISMRYLDAVDKEPQQSLYNAYCRLEDRILLRSLGQQQRHLDQKKVIQLSAILEGMINEAASANEEISRHAVQFTKVKVNRSFTDVRVWWLCTGVNDEEIEAALKSQRHNLRKTLSDSIGVNCPELLFEPDRSELMMQ
ncbi:hypothetical protein ANCCAN_23690, partial [Ancylostoma caninum]